MMQSYAKLNYLVYDPKLKHEISRAEYEIHN